MRHIAVEQILGGFEAEILELDEPTRLRWAWGFVGPDRDSGRATLHGDADGGRLQHPESACFAGDSMH